MCHNIVVSLVRALAVGMVLTALCGAVSGAGAELPAKLHVGVNASFVRAGGGSLWVTDPVLGQLVRVDPAAGKVKARRAVSGYPFGIALGGGSVWVGSRLGARVTRFSAKTNKRLARIRVGSAPYALAYGKRAVWVTNEGLGTVSRIAPKRNKVVKTIRVGGQPNGIAFAFGKVWVADYGRGGLIRIDPARNKVTGRIAIPKADWITPSADSLWISSETGSIYRVDPASLAVRAVVSVGANPLASAWIGGELWVPNIDSSTVSVVSPATNATRLTIPVGPSPIAVAGAAGAGWVSSQVDGDLWRLSVP
jgi:YVTN family beta-propeller protein